MSAARSPYAYGPKVEETEAVASSECCEAVTDAAAPAGDVQDEAAVTATGQS
jgi:hypothetical protein